MNTPVDTCEPLIVAEDVADMLGVTVAWVHEMARDGALPSYKLGRYWRFRASEIDVWLTTQAKSTYKRRTE